MKLLNNAYSLLPKNRMSIKMKGFCSSNKLVGIIYAFFRLLVDLRKSFTIFTLKQSFSKFIYDKTDFCIEIC